MRRKQRAIGGEDDVKLSFTQQFEERIDMFINKRLATMHADQ